MTVGKKGRISYPLNPRVYNSNPNPRVLRPNPYGNQDSTDLDARRRQTRIDSQQKRREVIVRHATWDISKALVGHDYNQAKMTNWKKVIFEYVCPTLGIFISTALYSAPVKVSGIVRSCFYEKTIHLISSAIA